MSSREEGRQEAAVLDAKALEAALEEANSPMAVTRSQAETIESSIRAYLHALPAPVAAVAVKTLEWQSSRQGAWARSVFGIYYASALTQLMPTRIIFRWKLTVDGVYSNEVFETEDAAKVAAQADFEARIRSALIPAKPAVEVVEALKVAREEIVIAIAFLGRDAGTSRIDRTIESLINRLVKADQLAQAALHPVTPDAQTEVENDIAADNEAARDEVFNTWGEEDQ